MNLSFTDILRGGVSSIMNAILLFLMAQPRYSRKTTNLVIFGVFIVDMISSLYFYSIGEFTALAKFDILLFLALAILLKPFVKDSLMQWLFHVLTSINIYFVIVCASYYLCLSLPYPSYMVSFLRFILYFAFILIYCKILRPTYRLVTENWKVYFLLVFSIFMNFSYYIFSSNDIKATIQNQSIHILLLIFLAAAVYITIFHLLQKDMMQKQLKRDKIHFEQMAFKDSLTGVGNRNGYEELAKVVETMEDKQKICVGAFDINDLKKVNDTMGHDMGDKYICDCCQIICRAHKSSAVFRMGGDEFVVVSKYSSDTYINDSINSIMSLTNEYNNRNSPYKISIAYGYERFHIEKYPTLNDVKNEADRLMYENKKIMKNKKAQSI